MQMLEADSLVGVGEPWQVLGFEPLVGRETMVLGGFAASAAAGPCVTCRWACGDGRVFECELRSRVTQGEGCAGWEREAGAD